MARRKSHPNENENKACNFYSVHFVLKKMTDAEELHVHFDEDNDGLKSNNVVVRKKGDRKIEVQLGKLVR